MTTYINTKDMTGNQTSTFALGGYIKQGDATYPWMNNEAPNKRNRCEYCGRMSNEVLQAICDGCGASL